MNELRSDGTPGSPGAPGVAWTYAPPTPSAWSQRDIAVVLVLGLVGGSVAGLLVEVHFWLQNGPLLFLHHVPWVRSPGIFLYQGIAATLAVTHALFAGLVTRRRFAMVATAALSFVPQLLIVWKLEPLLLGFGSIDLGAVALYLFFVLIVVAGVAEALSHLVDRSRGSIVSGGVIGLAVPIGLTAFLLLQTLLPRYGGGWAQGWTVFDWVVWLGLAGGWAFVVSGILPTLLAQAFGSVGAPAASAPVPMAAPVNAVRAGALPPDESMNQYGVAPGGLLPEHPQATTALVLGLIGFLAFAPLAPVAWVMASRARAEMRQFPGRYRASGTLTAGYVLGVCGTVMIALGIVALLVLMAFAINLPGLR